MKNTKNLLDAVIKQQNLKNDAALARALELAPPVISKLRHGRVILSPVVIVRIHEAFGNSVADIKQLAGVPTFSRTKS